MYNNVQKYDKLELNKTFKGFIKILIEFLCQIQNESVHQCGVF
jgi:hypothetical protein